VMMPRPREHRAAPHGRDGVGRDDGGGSSDPDGGGGDSSRLITVARGDRDREPFAGRRS
jgi:hypothetical protein